MKLSRRFLFIFGMVLGLITLAHVSDIRAEEDSVENKKLEEKQRQIQRNFMQLIRRIEKTADIIKKDDPETAQRMTDALTELRKLKIPDQMEDVIKYIQSEGKYQLPEKRRKIVYYLG